MRRTLLAVLLLAALPACAGSAGRRDLGSWFEARGADLMDVVGVRVAVGIGLGGYVRATEWAQLGLMRRHADEEVPEPVELGGAEPVGLAGHRSRRCPQRQIGLDELGHGGVGGVEDAPGGGEGRRHRAASLRSLRSLREAGIGGGGHRQ